MRNKNLRKNRKGERPALWIAMAYAVLGILWILFSDRLALMISNSPETLTKIAILKGWLYVLLTALLLYKLVSRSMKELESSQEAHLQAKQDWEQTFDAVPDLICILDNDYQIVRVNKAMAARLGAMPEDYAGLKCYQAVHGANEPPSFCPHSQLLKDGCEHSREVREDRLAGDFIVSVSPLFDPAGTLKGSVHVARNITDRKQTEEALRESEAKYRALIETTDTGFVIIDQKGIVLDANREYVRLTGHQHLNEILGRSVTEWTAPYLKEENTLAVRKCFEAGYVRNLEIDYIDSEGKITPIEINATVVEIGGTSQILTLCRDISERKKAEEALRQAERNFRNSLDESMMGVRIVSSEGETLYANRALLDMYGYDTVNELKATPVTKRYTPESLVGYQLRKQKRKQGENGPSEYAIGIVRKNGGIRDLQVFRKQIVWDGGQHFQVLYQDITERKRAEEELKLNELRLETLLQLNQMTSATLHEIAEFAMEEAVRLTQSTIGYVAFMNADETVLTMHAWSRQAMQECRIVEKPLDYPVETTGLWGEAVRQRRPVITNDYTAPNPLKRGTPPGHVTIKRHMNVPILDNERVVIVAGVGNKPTDYGEADVRQLSLLMSGMWRIVQRRMAEESLRLSEEKYRLVIENANDAIFIAQDGRIKFPNSRLSIISGFSLEELTLKPFVQIVHPEDRGLAAANDKRRLEGADVPSNSSFRLVNKSGETLWVEVNSVVISWEGKPASLNFLRDVTAQKKLESQLLHAQKMESIGTLAGGIAHDFNNILAAIIGYSEIIKVKFKEPGLHSYLKQILTSCDRAKNLVGQILTFSRAKEQAKMPIDMALLIEEGLNLLRATLPSTITFQQKTAPGTYTILADPTQIHQVLINLCTNAAHAMRERGGEIEVGLDRVEVAPHVMPLDVDLGPGHYVKLSIGDNGGGIPPEVMHRIFDPFFTTKKAGEGTGLGLSVVYGIVKGCGGAVTVQSEVGSGSVFDVYLPAITCIAEAKAERSEPVPGGTERILFVDDEEILVTMWCDILKNLGYMVTATTKSMKALDLFRTQPDHFDLVITDMTMPGMTGMELSKEILRIRPGIPIILCTGFNELVSEENAKEIGVREFAMKPLSLKRIATLIRKALEGRV